MDEEIEELETEELEDEIDRGDEVEELEDDEDDIEEVETEEDDEEVIEDEELDDEPEDIQIPKARLDEVIAQREAQKDRVDWLEQQLETLINQKQVPEERTKEVVDLFDFSKAEEDYANFLIEGEVSKASALRSNIDTERKKEMQSMIDDIKQSSEDKAVSTSQEAIENDRFSTMISNFENKHSFLDADSETYNEEAVETVNTLLAGYQASGKTKSQALKMAVSKVIPMYDVKPEKQSLGNKKKVTARRKAVKASQNQPPKTSSKGVKDIDMETVNISKLSEKDFDSLTAKEKRVLRGD